MPTRCADHVHDALLSRVLQSITRSVSRRPWGTLGTVLLLCLVSLVMCARFLEFKTSRADLIDPDLKFHQRWLRYTERFGDQSDVVVVVETPAGDETRRVLDELGGALDVENELFSRCLYRIDLGGLESKALQYVAPRDLEAGLARLETYGPILEGHWERAGLESYAWRLKLLLERPHAPGDATDQVRMTQTMQFCESLGGFDGSEGSFQSPWPSILNSTGAEPLIREPQYLLNDSETMGYLLAVPTDASNTFDGTSRSITRLRALIRETGLRHPEARIGLTGIPVLEADEMERSQRDMLVASIISFIGVGLLLLLGFRGFRHPLLALIMLGVGLAWSVGYTTLAVGHLNILSVSFAAILIGLGIDFAIHYLARYLELRHEGWRLRPALVQSSAGVGTGIVTAAVTTALAFLCATFTDFLGVAELGIIAGGGIMLCAAATFLVLPALITLGDRNVEPRKLPTPFQGTWLRRIVANRPGVVTLMSLAVIAAVGSYGFSFRDGRIWSRVKYDANLLNLQAEDLASVEVQHRVFEQSQGSLLYAVSLAKDESDTRRLARQYEALPAVQRVEHLATLMPTYPAEETCLLVQGFQARLANVTALPRELPEVDPASIGRALEDLYLRLKQTGSPDSEFAAAALDLFLNRLEQLPLGQQVELLARYQYAMLTSLREQFLALSRVSSPAPVVPADLPAAVRERFLSPQGDWLVKVFPARQVWDEQPLEEFVTAVRTVDPEVTGTPLQNYEAARQIRDSYLDAAVYALAIICLVLLVDSLDPGPLWMSLLAPLGVVAFAVVTLHGAERSLNPVWLVCLYVAMAVAVAAIFDALSVRNTFLTLLPPLGGGLLMFGILGAAGIGLNPANLIVLPLILGIGIDDGVHVIHDFRMQTGRYQIAPSTINAITLTSLTSMIGFGSMLVASHQGLVSLALVLVIGVGSCLFVSLVVLPSLLTLISNSAGSAQQENLGEEGEEPEILTLPPRPRRLSA